MKQSHHSYISHHYFQNRLNILILQCLTVPNKQMIINIKYQ